jgi:hypothetical protein
LAELVAARKGQGVHYGQDQRNDCGCQPGSIKSLHRPGIARIDISQPREKPKEGCTY